MDILEEAKKTVDARRTEYGDPEVNLQDIANAWSSYVHAITPGTPELSATDVCLMMILVKVHRHAGKRYHRDTIMDIIGYAYIIALLNGEGKTDITLPGEATPRWAQTEPPEDIR
jgi:hypothetical protein